MHRTRTLSIHLPTALLRIVQARANTAVQLNEAFVQMLEEPFLLERFLAAPSRLATRPSSTSHKE